MQILDINGQELPNFSDLNKEDGTIFGRHNKVKSVNPFNCRFVATYPGGVEVKGNDLFQTGWDDIENGLIELRYELSTGHVVGVPKYKAYLPLIEVSFGIDNSRIFHFINVHCLAEKEVIIYKIVLRQDNLVPQKIGDVVLSRQPLPKDMYGSWKYTS